MELRILEINDIAEQVKEFVLADTGGSDLPGFQPGSHVELTIDEGARTYVRRYSLTSRPGGTSAYRVAVLRTPQSRGGSRYLHEQACVGDTIRASGPFNAFGLAVDADHHILVAGGIGITPFVPMVEQLAATKASFELHYAARGHERFAYLTRLRELAPDHVVTYTPTADGKQTLDLDTLLAARPDGAHVYVCGPRRMIEASRSAAMRVGFAPDQIHFESFGAPTESTDKAITVRLAATGVEMRVDPGQSILDAMLEHGAFAPYDCRRGECGTCATEIVSGDPDHRDVCLSQEQRETLMCTCVSWARGPLELNL